MIDTPLSPLPACAILSEKAEANSKEGLHEGSVNGVNRETAGRAGLLMRLIVLCLAGGCTVLLLCSLTGNRSRPEPHAIPLSARIANYDEIVASVRHGLHYHAESITVTFTYGERIQKELTAVAGDWVEAALEETDDPAEGDYIRYQYGGYEIECACRALDGGRYLYTVTIIPRHYTFLEQEEKLNAVVTEIEKAFGFTSSTSEYEKIRTIYDFVCSNIRYDQVHRNNEYAHLRSTCYSALIWHTAACQGYSVTLYRLLRDAGINCRVVTGNARRVDSSEEFHAWNIVELEGKWYNLDATWDAGRENWRFFLRGGAHFTDHTPGKSFISRDFVSRYAISEADWPCPENLPDPGVVFG